MDKTTTLQNLLQRLLDFGVGKLLAGKDSDQPTEQPAFTFAYAAPEQFRGAATSRPRQRYARPCACAAPAAAKAIG